MEIDEDLKAFLVESNENLSHIEGDLVALEQAPADQELMNRIYRELHTIKGNCGFLGFEQLQAVAHAGESLLSHLRDGQLALTADMTSALLQVVDAIKAILNTLEATGEEGEANYAVLLEMLGRLQAGGAEGAEENPVETQPVASETASETASLPVSNTTQATSVADSAIRVDVGLLDKLMNLVGELVLCRNQILEFSNRREDTTLAETSQRLNVVTTELQEGVMQTRMQPIRNIWSKFPRVIRDLSLSLGKQVHLEMEGEDTELDKTLIEAIADPLNHLVRNCIDHGIELPQLRLTAGKPAAGCLFLRAAHESGYVTIEIADDGSGIDPARLKTKALQHNLITAEQASRMSDQEALNLIFLPGLSTAQQVTNLSGRGVGMDVVRTNIEKIGGTIDVQSAQGAGTTFKLRIPLTLAIIPTLIVTSGGERYAIPQTSLLELVRLEGEQAHRGVEMVHGAPVYRLRGRLLPLVYLNQELQLDTHVGTPQGAAKAVVHAGTIAHKGHHLGLKPDVDDTLNIVVLQAADKPFGLVVDSINDTQEIVVKPLSKQLKGITCFAGATIMGDGRVALILDVQGLAQNAHMVSEGTQESARIADKTESRSQLDQRQTLLLCQGPDRRRMAIPLSGVARLEQFPHETIERAGHQDVIQYRQQILPLTYLSTIFASDNPQSQVPIEGETLQVVVVSGNQEDYREDTVGLVVERILDIVEEQVTIRGPATQPEVECTAVIQGKVTEILDIEAVAQTADTRLSRRAIAV
ncbi:MAG: chemotaxis protein CheA [Cyanothece sp. SIO1E1]|nr:chemotaxis protein CheA [Cyanothece sp. SIO1E1]